MDTMCADPLRDCLTRLGSVRVPEKASDIGRVYSGEEKVENYISALRAIEPRQAEYR